MIYRFIGLRHEITEICSINRKHRSNWTVTLTQVDNSSSWFNFTSQACHTSTQVKDQIKRKLNATLHSRNNFKKDCMVPIQKLWNNWQQFPWTKKAVSRTAALLFDNNNACILKQNTNTARLCRFVFKGFKSGSGTTRLQDELDLFKFVSIFTWLKYFRMVHSEPMVLFVVLAESFCLCIFCLLLLLGIVVVYMLLAALSSYLK